MPELSASTGWNGGGSYGRAKDRRKLYVANRRDIRLYNRRISRQGQALRKARYT